MAWRCLSFSARRLVGGGSSCCVPGRAGLGRKVVGCGCPRPSPAAVSLLSPAGCGRVRFSAQHAARVIWPVRGRGCATAGACAHGAVTRRCGRPRCVRASGHAARSCLGQVMHSHAMRTSRRRATKCLAPTAVPYRMRRPLAESTCLHSLVSIKSASEATPGRESRGLRRAAPGIPCAAVIADRMGERVAGKATAPAWLKSRPHARREASWRARSEKRDSSRHRWGSSPCRSANCTSSRARVIVPLMPSSFSASTRLRADL